MVVSGFFHKTCQVGAATTMWIGPNQIPGTDLCYRIIDPSGCFFMPEPVRALYNPFVPPFDALLVRAIFMLHRQRLQLFGAGHGCPAGKVPAQVDCSTAVKWPVSGDVGCQFPDLFPLLTCRTQQ